MMDYFLQPLACDYVIWYHDTAETELDRQMFVFTMHTLVDAYTRIYIHKICKTR